MTASAFPEKSTEQPTDRPDPRVERSRAKLLAAATDLLVEAGPRALTVDNVAERSGVAKSTLYRHWPSRTALMIDVLRTNIPCTPVIDPADGFEPCLREYISELAESLADPEWARIMPALFALRQQFPEVGDMTETDRDEKVALLRGLLDRGVAEGLIPEGLDPHAVAHVLVGPMMMCALVGEPEGAKAAGDFALDRFLASYRATDDA
jgi:AcrR family transcriptional regulator